MRNLVSGEADVLVVDEETTMKRCKNIRVTILVCVLTTLIVICCSVISLDVYSLMAVKKSSYEPCRCTPPVHLNSKLETIIIQQNGSIKKRNKISNWVVESSTIFAMDMYALTKAADGLRILHTSHYLISTSIEYVADSLEEINFSLQLLRNNSIHYIGFCETNNVTENLCLITRPIKLYTDDIIQIGLEYNHDVSSLKSWLSCMDLKFT